MKEKLTITIAQLNVTVGRFAENKEKILNAHKQAEQQGADLVVYSELCVTGYPPEDLVRKPAFYKRAMAEVSAIMAATEKSTTALLIGAPWYENGELYNAALLISGGKLVAKQYKHDLPNYGVFDEKRIFSAGPVPYPIEFEGVKIGVMICEDMWHTRVMEGLRSSDFLIAINASPFEVGKHAKRLERAGMHVRAIGKPIIYVNQICGHDDLVFDGDSFVFSRKEELRVRLSRSKEAVEPTYWYKEGDVWRSTQGVVAEYGSQWQVMYQAMMLGLRDYVEKNNFPGVVIGMSGGIDSALSAAVAVDALGAEKVRLVMMPSQFTSQESLDDVKKCADALGVELENIAIEPMVKAFGDSLAPSFVGEQRDITEENIQSRIRGVLLMAFSNKFGHMVLSTGNKSEMAVGYATLYGDMCGGYNVLKDAYKTQVFEVSKWRNTNLPEDAKAASGEVIPTNIITKPPTAELRENQKDEDSLPAYDVLDQILFQLIEREASLEEVIEQGFDAEIVQKVCRLLYLAEYKRRQSPPGVKLSEKPFSRDRRYPITNGFME